MKPWRLTRRAERSLVEIFAWTIEQFGEEQFGQRQAIAYRDALIERIELIAQGQPPHPRPCGPIAHASADDLVYYREGGHYITMRDAKDTLIVLEFFHQAIDLPRHLQTL